ncbi:hypothetical protein [Azospirillum endophyticum]
MHRRTAPALSKAGRIPMATTRPGNLPRGAARQFGDRRRA